LISPKEEHLGPKNQNVADSTEGAPLQSVMRRTHICFERIIPDELDAEQHVRRALRSEMMASVVGSQKLNASDVAHVARMAVVVSKKWAVWNAGFVPRCRFLDGSAKMQKTERTLAKGWEKFTNVKLKFVPQGPEEV
jgi:hypothetical protein